MSHDRTGKPAVCRDTRHAQGHEIQRHNSESEQIRTLLDRHSEQILADCQAEIRKHDFQADYDRRSIQKLSETVESQQEELHRVQAEELQRRDQQLLHEQSLKQNWDLREAHEKSLNEMEEVKRFQGSTFDTIARRNLVEDQDTTLELTGKIQELQNEINCMSDSRDFQASQLVRSGDSHVTSQPVSFPPFQNPGGMLSRSSGMPSRKDGPPSIWDTHCISGIATHMKPWALSQTIHNKNDGRLKSNDYESLTCTCYSWDKWQEGRKDVFSHSWLLFGTVR